MEAKIFKDAKFGDKFRARDGRMAIYWRKLDYYHRLISDELSSSLIVRDDGRLQIGENHNSDIVGEWQEPISEEELDKLVESEIQLIKSKSDFDTDVCMIIEKNKSWFIDGFERGYRKALGL